MSDNKVGSTNPGARGRGRPKGTQNKTTRLAKEAIQYAAEGLGGAERLIAWAKEAPENERVFWASIYTKLLPLQVNGAGEDGEHLVSLIERRIVKADN